jgi:hypothetical protein
MLDRRDGNHGIPPGRSDTSPLAGLSFWIVAVAITWWGAKRHGLVATVSAELAVGLFALTARALLVARNNPGAGHAALLFLLAGAILSVLAFATNTRKPRQEREEEQELERRLQEAHAEWLQQRSPAPQPSDAVPRLSQQADTRPRLSQLSEFSS